MSSSSADRLLKHYKKLSETEKQGYRFITSLECTSCKARFTLRRPQVIDTSEIDVPRMERRANELRTSSRCQNCGSKLIDLSDEEAVKQEQEKKRKAAMADRERFLNSPKGQELKLLQEKARKLNE